MTEEEKMELEFDKKHLSMELVAVGDDINRPLTGDVVRVRYTAYLLTTTGLYNAETLKVCHPSLSLMTTSVDDHEHQIRSAEAVGGVRAGHRDDRQRGGQSHLQNVHRRAVQDPGHSHLRLRSPPRPRLAFLN
jgi:hypothetical protein